MLSSAAAAVPKTLLLLLVWTAVAAAGVPASLSRGWHVRAGSKQEAHQHARRALMAHDEHGPALMQSWFQDWKVHHGRSYTDEAEEARAFSAFQDNMRLVHDINTNATLTYWASGNQFSDLTWDQFKAKYLGTPHDPLANTPNQTASVNRTTAASALTSVAGRRLLQQSFDWRNKGIVTPVRNQGSCNACWVMAGIHSLEAAYMISQGLSSGVQFSAQQALDCFNLGGCSWGSAAEMMNTLTSQPITTESNYPLFSDETGAIGSCKSSVVQSAVGNRQAIEFSSGTAGYDRFELESESTLIQAMQVNPLVHHYQADVAFMTYAGGVYTAGTCDGVLLNHAITNYGFNLNEGSWTFKNSWGPNWGESGYVRIKMIGGQGTCGLYKWVFRPSLSFAQTLSSAATSAAADKASAVLATQGRSPPRPPPSSGR